MLSVCMEYESAVIRSDWSAGPRPYMEDRYTIISSYTPLSFTSQPMPDDIVRSYAAVFDGHNGTKAAEHACARHALDLAMLKMCSSRRRLPGCGREHSSQMTGQAVCLAQVAHSSGTGARAEDLHRCSCGFLGQAGFELTGGPGSCRHGSCFEARFQCGG